MMKVRRWTILWFVLVGCDPSGGGELADGVGRDAGGDGSQGVSPDGSHAATAGLRCALERRIGLVEIRARSHDPLDREVRAYVNDTVDPTIGAPASTTSTCELHVFDPRTACAPCAADTVCSFGGSCETGPSFVASTLTLRGTDGASQTLSSGEGNEVIDERLTLETEALALELSYGETKVTLGPTSIPAELGGLAGALTGTDMAPTGVSVRWRPTTSSPPSQVFTHININHHAAGPTFTECAVGADAGSFSIPEGMVAPLAVSTGLEFQGIEHMRVAAAETPEGCIEIRFVRHQGVRLDAPPVR